MKKKNQILIIISLSLFLVIIFTLCISIIVINNNNNIKSVEIDTEKYESIYCVLGQKRGINTRNIFSFYDNNGNVIKEEKKKDSADVSYSYFDDSNIYSFGPGGLYKTSINNLKTEKISDEDVNIVKEYNGNLYYFVNGGFKDNGYLSTIVTPNERYDIDAFVSDFALCNDKIYVLVEDGIYVCSNSKEIKKIEIDSLIYKNILEIDNRIFLLDTENIYEVVEDKIVNFAKNNIIKDLNFECIVNNNENLLIDSDLNKIFKVELEENNINITYYSDYEKTFDITYDFKNKEIIKYSTDYKNNKINISKIDNTNTVTLNVDINDNTSIFNIYKIK